MAIHLDGGGVLRAVAAEPQLAMMHHFVLVTGTNVTFIDVAGDCEITTLLRDLQVPVIRKPFDLTTVFAVVDDIIARETFCVSLPNLRRDST